MARGKKTKKPNSRRYKAYNDETMQKAVTDVANGGKYSVVAKRNGLNRTTLMNHCKNFKCGKVGRPTVLTLAEEEMLVHSLVKLGEWGYGFDRLQLQRCVQDYLRRMDRENPFKNGMPGIEWCMMFENRWKEHISRRVAQNLPKNRAIAGTEAVMADMYEKLDNILTCLDLRNKPQNIFNCDEIGFQTEAGVQKVICQRGSRNPNKLVGSVTKATYTVLMCCSAVGDFLPMFINYKGLHLYSTWCQGGPEKALYNCSPSGWMEAAQFLDWFEKCFVKETSTLEGNKLLILDGHNSHISLDLIELASANNIEILCLPAHTSHLLQPLDVGVYKSVKNSWRLILRQFYQKTGYKNVDKLVFPSLMKQLSESGAISRANAIGGFEGSGIYPPSKEKMLRKVEMAELISNGTSQENVPLNEDTPSTSKTNLQSTSSVSLDDHKKSLELAIMSIITTKNGKEKNSSKRTRVSRKFAECLTSEEVKERIRLSEGTKAAKKTPKRKKRARESSSSESDVEVICDDDDDTDNVFAAPVTADSDILEGDISGEPQVNHMQNEIKVGSWVIAKYGNAYYVGHVLKKNRRTAEINFLRKKGLYFVYPDVVDKENIELKNIKHVLEDPHIHRGKHYFKLDFPEEITLIN